MTRRGIPRLCPTPTTTQAQRVRHRWAPVLAITLVGLIGLALGGELVAEGAQRLIVTLELPALLVGMVLTPAAVEIEEVFRQASPLNAATPK